MRLLTTTEAARQLGVPLTTLRKRLAKQGVKVWKLGNYCLVYDVDALAAIEHKTPKSIEV